MSSPSESSTKRCAYPHRSSVDYSPSSCFRSPDVPSLHEERNSSNILMFRSLCSLSARAHLSRGIIHRGWDRLATKLSRETGPSCIYFTRSPIHSDIEICGGYAIHSYRPPRITQWTTTRRRSGTVSIINLLVHYAHLSHLGGGDFILKQSVVNGI